MNPPDGEACDEALLEYAVELARAAGALTLEYFGKPSLVVDAKADGTEVTDADRNAERLVRERLAERFGDDAVVGEEHGGQLTDGGRTWIVDPIDGTAGFVRGVPLYATLLALIDEHGPVLGVVHLPALGSTLAAGRGAGCWLNGSRATVSDHNSVKGALVNTSDYSTFSDNRFGRVRNAGALMRTWGDAYGYVLVATGNAEAMVDPVCEVWDLAPMPVILSEAGGRFTDLEGAPSFTSRCGVATNGILHDDLLDLLADVPAAGSEPDDREPDGREPDGLERDQS